MPQKPTVRTTMTRVLVIQAIALLALWLLQTHYGS
jgi:hypothetical protein